MDEMSARQCEDFGELVGLPVKVGLCCNVAGCFTHAVVTPAYATVRLFTLIDGRMVEELVFN
jgi:hypothetical protein